MKDKQIGTYRITDELLGEGSFSKVYLGYDSKQQKVAVKTISR
jgi:serine/threonine protein kinase